MGRLLKKTVYAVLGGLTPLFLCVVLMRVWVDPLSVDNGGWLRFAATLIMIEFLLVHSGAFMAAGPLAFPRFKHRLLWFTGFGSVYGLSIYFYASWSGGQWVGLFLAALLVSRLLTLVILDDKRGTVLLMQRSVIGVVVLVITGIVMFIPLPELGIDATLRGNVFGHGDDLLALHPQRSIAWGALYFLLMGAIEAYAGWTIPDLADGYFEDAWDQLSAPENIPD